MFNRVTGTALAVLFVALVTGQIYALLNQGVARSGSHPMLVTILILLTADFTTCWLHRLHRQFPVLWPIHALHPSAEELNPVTAYHHHPFYKVMGGAVLAVMQGLVQGIALGLIVGKVDPAVLPGSTAYDIQTVRAQPASQPHLAVVYGLAGTCPELQPCIIPSTATIPTAPSARSVRCAIGRFPRFASRKTIRRSSSVWATVVADARRSRPFASQFRFQQGKVGPNSCGADGWPTWPRYLLPRERSVRAADLAISPTRSLRAA